MTFKAEISIGTVIELGMFVIALFVGIRKLGNVEAKVEIMYAWFEHSIINPRQIVSPKNSSGD